MNNVNNFQYEGTATTADGKQYEAKGTMTEMANWADNIIRVANGNVDVKIVQIETK